MKAQISSLAAEIMVAGKLRAAEPTLRQEDAEALARVHLTLLKQRGTPLPLEGCEMGHLCNTGFYLQTPAPKRARTDLDRALRPTWVI